VPTLPWTTGPRSDVAPTGEVVLMASRFRLRGLRHVLPFFLDAMRVHAQTRRADGALGVSLVAHPLKREFFTLSAWRDRAALDALVRTEPHRSVMKRHHGAMEASAFTFWTAEPATLPPSWDDVNDRLAATPDR
jgi:quinol monooxygenase YgiN